MEPHKHQEAPVGRSLKSFARACGLGLSTLYTIPVERRPRSIRIGRRVIVTEQPADWLRRVGRTEQEAA